MRVAVSIKGLLSIGILFLMNACGQVVINDKCECGFFATQTSSIMIWPTDKREITFYFHNSVPTKAKAAIYAAADAYNAALTNEVKIIIKDDSASSPIHGATMDPDLTRGDGVNGIYWIDQDWPFADDATSHEDGMTVIDFGTTNIKEADIFIRGSSFADLTKSGFDPTAVGDYTTFDKKAASYREQLLFVLSAHEMGHALGRNHTETHESIMTPVVGIESLDNPLTSYDVTTLTGAYKP